MSASRDPTPKDRAEYVRAGAPYGKDADGLKRWLAERTRPVPHDPRMTPPPQPRGKPQ